MINIEVNKVAENTVHTVINVLIIGAASQLVEGLARTALLLLAIILASITALKLWKLSR